MTRDEIATMIAGIGLPNAYDQFKKEDAPDGPPFICFLYTANDDFLADDSNYQPITGLRIELYVDAPDFAKEAAVESALNGAGLVYAKDGPEYLDGERMYMTTWETTVVLTEPPPTPPTPPNDTEVLETNVEEQG